MTFTIRVRGAPSQPITQEFECPDHGRFTATAPRDTESMPCPEEILCPEGCPDEWVPCGLASPWVISAPMGRVNIAEVSRGKSDGPPTEAYMSTRSLFEGQSMQEWRDQRAKMWTERDRKKDKEAMG